METLPFQSNTGVHRAAGVRWSLDLGILTLVGINLGQVCPSGRVWGALQAQHGEWEAQSCPVSPSK